GGFSVDSCYMAQEAEIVVHCELNEGLSQIVKHNAEQLGVRNLVPLFIDGVKFVEAQEDDSLDYIYIDPSRRVNNTRVFLLEDCEPNIVALQDMFLRKARYVISKISPLMDINSALLKLKHVKLLYVISLDGDCKELLFLQDRTFEGETKITAIRLSADQLQNISFTPLEEKTTLVKTSAPLKYLYDPDVAVTKCFVFYSITNTFTLFNLLNQSHLYTSKKLESHFL